MQTRRFAISLVVIFCLAFSLITPISVRANSSKTALIRLEDVSPWYAMQPGGLDALKWIADYLSLQKVPFQISRKVKAFVGQYFYDRDCSAIGRQIVIGHNGDIGICPAFYGSGKYFVQPKEGLENFDPYSHSYWQEWGKRLTLNFSKCLKCSALAICGGGCPYNAWMRHGSIWEVDDSFCDQSLKTLEWLIWDLYDQSHLYGKIV